jgi:hypothetical protein
LRVTGFVLPPSILTTRPFSTVTSSVQESGQSRGQAVRTVERPQVSGAIGRGIPDYLTAPRSADDHRPSGPIHAGFHTNVRQEPQGTRGV